MVDENVNNTERAAVKLLELCYNTKTGLEGLIGDEKLTELTRVPRQMVYHLSLQMTREIALNPKRIEMGIRLSKCWRTFFFQLMRSVEGKHLMTGIALAESQMASQSEEESESWEM